MNETNVTREAADNADVESQLECFGLGRYYQKFSTWTIVGYVFLYTFLVYPENCTKYYGPHSIACLVTMWEAATCLPQGYKYPEKLSSSRVDELDTWNIRFGSF